MRPECSVVARSGSAFLLISSVISTAFCILTIALSSHLPQTLVFLLCVLSAHGSAKVSGAISATGCLSPNLCQHSSLCWREPVAWPQRPVLPCQHQICKQFHGVCHHHVSCVWVLLTVPSATGGQAPMVSQLNTDFLTQLLLCFLSCSPSLFSTQRPVPF